MYEDDNKGRKKWIIILILAVSLVPTIVGLLKAKFGKKKSAETTSAEQSAEQ